MLKCGNHRRESYYPGTRGKSFFVAALSLVVLLPVSLAADVIVLKSGRRIEASSVRVEDGRVHYVTELGEFAIPERLVERIERGDYRPPAPSAAAGKKNEPAVSGSVREGLGRFSTEGLEDVVENGSVNHARLAELEQAADRQGSPQARQRAAAAHVLVAQHYLEQREWERARSALLRALVFAPNHPVLLLRLAVLEMDLENYDAALERLRPVLSDEDWAAEGYKLQGILYYRQERMEPAVRAWERSLELRPDAELAQQLAAMQKEAEASSGFGEQSSPRFTLRYTEEVRNQSGLARDILGALESLYSDVADRFHYYPREPVVVLLYPQQSYQAVTGAPDWSAGQFDGKIRIPVQGLSSLNAQFLQTLKHELIHAFVYLKTRGRASRWLQEGLAQWHAGEQPRVARSAFTPLFAVRDGSALMRIQSGFGGTPQQVYAAYAASWLVVDVLERRFGASARERLLEGLGSGQSFEQALRRATGLDPAKLDALVADNL